MRCNIMGTNFLPYLMFLLLAGFAGTQAVADELDELIDSAMAGDHRNPEFVARDKYRHPKETLKFFGLTPGMTVVEIWPSRGWYTEILAPVLRKRVVLYAAGVCLSV